MNMLLKNDMNDEVIVMGTWSIPPPAWNVSGTVIVTQYGNRSRSLIGLFYVNISCIGGSWVKFGILFPVFEFYLVKQWKRK